MEHEALKLEGLQKRFGRKYAVQEISLEIQRGETYGLVGRNGAGKTTTIRMINGIIRPDKGMVRTLGVTPAKARNSMGYLPEERGLYPDMSAKDMAAYMGELRLLKRKDALARAEQRLTAWGIDPKQRIHSLSKGMAQAVQVIGTTLHDPDLLTLDEPFSGLDPIAQTKLEAMVQDRRSKGLTTILSTHVMSQAERLCDKITIIDKGSVKYSGTMHDARRILPQKGHVRVSGVSPEEIMLILGPEAREEENMWTFPVSERPGQTSSDLLVELMKHGRIEDFSIERASLHNVFVHLVGGQQEVAA